MEEVAGASVFVVHGALLVREHAALLFHDPLDQILYLCS
jgi:hypothetical protein